MGSQIAAWFPDCSVVLIPSPAAWALLLLAALGAGEGNRTPDLLITSEPLCRLSYPG